MPHHALSSAPTRASDTGSAARVLVVDGDPGVRETLAAALRGEGYVVRTAGQADDALAQLAESAFDLVLADLALEADADGLGLLGVLRREARGAQIIVLASYAALETALRALKAGAYGYLVKPTDVEELCVTVAHSLEYRRLKRELASRVEELASASTSIREFDATLRAQVGDATEALRQQIAALEATNRQLRETQDQHEQFVAMVAHELKSPLGLVMSYAQLSARPAATTEQIQHYTSEIIEAAHRLNRLVDDLRTATRLSTGHFDLRMAPCDLGEAVRGTIEGLRTTLPSRHFAYEAPADLGPVVVDVDRILQAVRNLLDNAIKYSTEGSTVEVRLAADERHISISVRDEGAGIPESEIVRLFRPFERGAGSAQVPGSGLGLYITRGIARAHGGELRMHNGEGVARSRGAVFTLVLARVALETLETPETPRDTAPE